MTDYVNLNLVQQIINLIPTSSWDLVIEKLISRIVDDMPSDVLKQLTGDPTGFEKAEAILHGYYTRENAHESLIVDSFRILGLEQTCYYLDLLNIFEDNNGIYQDSTTSLHQLSGGADVDEGSEEERLFNQEEEDV